MTDIETKALALLNEVLAERVHWQMTGTRAENASLEALCRAIEQHEAFRQEVSDAVMQAFPNTGLMPDCLGELIIHKPNPDPLVDAMDKLEWCNTDALAKDLRDTLDALGFEIREKSNEN